MNKMRTRLQGRFLFLSADNELVDQQGRPTRSVPEDTTIVLSRGLCRFEYIARGNAASQRNADAAALIAARTRAPFENSQHLVLKSGTGNAIWWWDAKSVCGAINSIRPGARVRYLPESVLTPPGEGWRHLACVDGYEVQFWKGSALLASSWRRRPLDEAQWSSFAAGIRNAYPPALMPMPVSVKLDPALARRLPRAREPGEIVREIQRGILAIAGLSLVAAGCFQARALRYDFETAAVNREIDDLRRQAPEAVPPAETEAILSLAEYQVRPAPLLAAAAFLETALKHSANVESWLIEDQQLRATITADASVPLDSLAADLEASGWFAEVSPDRPEPRRFLIVANVCNPGSESCNGASAAQDRENQ